MAVMNELPHLLQNIPLEMRQCIYRYAATDSSEERDIRIEFELVHWEGYSDGSGKFKVPALDVLVKMKEVSTSLYDEAIEHLTSSLFTWVLVSEEQPHLYLIWAIQKSYPQEILDRVSHLRLECVTVLGHMGSDPATVLLDYDMGSGISMFYEDRIAYEFYIHEYCDYTYPEQLLDDTRNGLRSVLFTFPAVLRLDIELDIVDCMLNRTLYDKMLPYVSKTSSFWERCRARDSMEDVAAIGSNGRAKDIDIHLVLERF